MKKIKIILQAYLLMLIHKIGLLEEDYSNVITQRQKACIYCPLRKGKWCSRNAKTISNNQTIQGCGCYLPAKYFTQDLEITPCPLDKWKNFDN